MSKTALILVDIQNDYFDGGKFPLHNMTAAAKQAKKLLENARAKNIPVVHIRHENHQPEAPFFNVGTEGAKIHKLVTPTGDEPVVVKQQVNSFRETNLKETLDKLDVSNVIIAGAMSCMCVDAITRAAADFGYGCTVAHDACAAPSLMFNGERLPAEHVHGSFMAALAMGYALVTGTDEILAQ